jgi:hypothetical protein
LLASSGLDAGLDDPGLVPDCNANHGWALNTSKRYVLAQVDP